MKLCIVRYTSGLTEKFELENCTYMTYEGVCALIRRDMPLAKTILVRIK